MAELGKPVPDYTFHNVLNNNGDNISLQELKGKTVILEFWATWCGSCIPAMKKLDSLQTQFENELEVIAISTENTERLEKFIKNTNSTLKIVSDSCHVEFFKYHYIPHSIIVDKNGIVRAITNPENINQEIIANLISNNEIDLKLKDDFYTDPTLNVKNIKSFSNLDYKIDLRGYDQKESCRAKTLSDIAGNTNGIEMWNCTLPRLYQTFFDIASPSRIFYRDSLTKDDFSYKNQNNLYCISIEVSNKYLNNWRQIGTHFLNGNFDINARMSIDTLDCYILKNVDNTILETKSDVSEFMFMGPIFKTKKIKISQLIKYLENFTSIPVLDKTNLNGEYDIELEWQIEVPKSLNAELKKYGLKLEKSDKKLPVEIMEIYRKK